MELAARPPASFNSMPSPKPTENHPHDSELTADYKHPEMGCEELLTRLAGMKNPCPVILASGYDETQVFDELAPTLHGLSLDMEFVAKPYSPQQMKAVLARHLGSTSPQNSV